MHDLDDIDRRLLRLVQEDAGLSSSEMAARVGVSAAVVARRIDRLEAAAVIVGWALDLDPKALGYEVSVSLRVTLDKTARRAFDEFITQARDVAEVDAVHTLLGRVDVRLNVLARDLEHYQQIYREKILSLPHVLDIEALMLVSDVKSAPGVPL